MKKATRDKLTFYLVLLVLGLVVGNYLGVLPSVPGKTTGKAPAPVTTPTTSTGKCPTDGVTTLNVLLRNSLNTSTEYLSETFYIFNSKGVKVGSLTTNSGGAGTSYATLNVDCDDTYKIYGATDDDANAKIEKADNGKLASDGSYVEIKAESNNEYLNLVGTKHADSVKVRMYSLTNNAFYYASAASSNSAWQTVTDGSSVTFKTTTDNSSAEAIGAGDTLSYYIEVKAANNYEDVCDFGCYVLLDVVPDTATLETYWNEPSVTIDGKIAENVIDKLNTYETRRFKSYERAYRIDSIDSKVHKIRIDLNAIQDPSADITVKIVSIGQYLSKDETQMLIGAAKDDTSYSPVVSEFSIVKDLS